MDVISGTFSQITVPSYKLFQYYEVRANNTNRIPIYKYCIVNEAETSCRIAPSLSIPLMNSNCFAITVEPRLSGTIRLSGLFTEVPTSPDNRGSTV